MSETSLFPHQTTLTPSPETLDTLTARSTRRLDGMKVDNIKPLVDRFVIPDLHRVFVPASGRLLNWSAPLASFLLVDVFFSNQVLAQHDLFRCWKEPRPARLVCTSCRNSSMRKWRGCTSLFTVRRSLRLLRNTDYLGVKVEGTFKGEQYSSFVSRKNV